MMRDARRTSPRRLLGAAAALASLAFFQGTVSATHEPADKVEATASAFEVMQAQGGAGSSSREVTLLEGICGDRAPQI